MRLGRRHRDGSKWLCARCWIEWLRGVYHDWWIADEEESRSLDERETAVRERQRASITYYQSRRKR